jgi:hypothetical protein
MFNLLLTLLTTQQNETRTFRYQTQTTAQKWK